MDEQIGKGIEEKYTQFTQPYPGQAEVDLELDSFPIFNEIEKKNPTKEQLMLRGEEAKRLNIIYDTNKVSYEDKNIRDILSNEYKNSNRMDDIYDIDLPEIFMRSSVVKLVNSSNKTNNTENIEEKKENSELDKVKKENLDEKIKYEMPEEDFDIDIDYNCKDSKNKVSYNEKHYDENINNNVLYDTINQIKSENNAIINIDEELEENKREEGEIYEEEENKTKYIKPKKNNIKKEKSINNDLKNKQIIDINEGINEEKISVKKEKIINSRPSINLNNKYNITTINIFSENNSNYYVGEIIEKGPNFPSNLGIIKFMDLSQFSQNFFGEQLEFNDMIIRDKDFEKIIRLIPVGNKKYLFSNENSLKDEITKEENDIIILHGRVGFETLYYIMKLTGQINNNCEYTIFKVKNNIKTINHFKNSIGINEERDINEDLHEIMNDDDIDYGIKEDPDVNYIVMYGREFLKRNRKLIKAREEVKNLQKEIEEKKKYNENFESTFEKKKEYYNNIINDLTSKIEAKKKAIEIQQYRYEENIKEELNCTNEYNKAMENKLMRENREYELKMKINNFKLIINDNKRATNEIDKSIEEFRTKYMSNSNLNNLNSLYDNDKLRQKMEILKEKEKKIDKIKGDILCIFCHQNKREIIFGECSHYLLCLKCFEKIQEKKNDKIKAVCPACKQINQAFFTITE